MDARDADGLRFRCLDGCGFCCTTSPGVAPQESRGLPATLLARRPDGSLGLRLDGPRCAALDGARRCGAYDARPSACRAFPVHLHALDEVEATLARACPGLSADGGAEARPAAALAAEAWKAAGAPGEAAARRARDNWREFRRRARLAGLWDEPAALRDVGARLAPALWSREAVERAYAAVEEGDVVAEDLEACVAGVEPVHSWRAIVADVAAETFAGDLPQWVDARAGAFRWVRAAWADGALTLVEARPDGLEAQGAPVPIDRLPLWRLTPDGRDALAAALARLAGRSLALGAAARLVDLTGYQVTLASAYGRVLFDQATGLALRAALVAHADGAREATAAHAREAVAWQETAFLALPTVGAVL